MKRSSSKGIRPVLAAAAALAMLFTQAAAAKLLEKTMTAGGTTVQYKVVLPDNYDSAKTYPAILAFGGGPQTMQTVDSVLRRNLQAEAEKRGYIVVAPAAPEEGLFFEGGARIFPEFLQKILAEYKVEDGKFHVAGPSNGGIAAFYVAAAYPQYFLSITAFPGYLWQATDAKLEAISKVCVFMYVGELDPYMWHDEMQREADFLRSKGGIASYTVERDQPHRLETLAGEHAGRLFEGFERARKGCGEVKP
ncbi:MAG TPA: alpha/beta hydrolase-fold protein [Gammaproteobacteria bacterium]|nr:alpha/beta hydrolase-fold protein [Gammaproteobacteria bacterium]